MVVSYGSTSAQSNLGHSSFCYCPVLFVKVTVMHQPLFSIWRSYCYLLSLQTYFLCTHLNLLNFCLSQFNLALPASYYAVLTTPWSSSSCLCTNNPGLGLSCVCANTHSLWDLMLYAQHFWSLEGHAVCTNTQGLWNPMLYALSPMAFGTSH